MTLLRAGMTLVAKEYVEAQDSDHPGILILSHFAGAAAQLSNALLVNPYSPDDIAEAIECALIMAREERIARWQPLYENVCREDVVWWRKQFTKALAHD